MHLHRLNVSRVAIHRLWVGVCCWQVWTLGRSVRGHWGPCAGSGQRAVTTTSAVSVHNANFSRSCSMHVISLFGHKEVPRQKRHFDTWLWHLWTMIALLYESHKEVPRENRHVDSWCFDTWIMIALLYQSPKEVPRENRHIDTWRFDTFESWLLCCINHPGRFSERSDTVGSLSPNTQRNTTQPAPSPTLLSPDKKHVKVFNSNPVILWHKAQP